MIAITALFSLLSLLFIWLLWEYGHKKMALDELRNNLFKLRHELFVLTAQSDELEFDSKFYRSFENIINSTIRFSHKINFFEIKVFSYFFKKKQPNVNIESHFEINFKKMEKKVKDTDTLNRLKKIRYELNKEIFKYLLKSSMTFLSFVIIVGIFEFIKNCSNSLRANLSLTMKQFSMTIENIKYQAETVC